MTTASGAEPKVHKMKSWTMPAFTLYSHDEARARKVVERAGAVEKLLTMLMSDQPVPSNPLHVFLVRDSVWTQYLRPSTMINAEFIPARFASYVLLSDRHSFESLDETVDHEFTHAFLRRYVPGHIPLWFDEGVAEFVDGTMILRDSVRLLPKGGRGIRWITMDRLLRADRSSPEYLTLQTSDFHRQAWAFVHKGVLDDRDFGQRTMRYLEALNQGLSIDDAVQRSFGFDVAALDRVVYEYASRRAFPYTRIPFEWPEPRPLTAGRELTDLEALDLLTQIMWDGHLNPGQLGNVAEAAKRRGAEATFDRALWAAIRNRTDAIGFTRHLAAMRSITEPRASRVAGLAIHGRIHDSGMDDPLTAEVREDAARLALKLLLQSERILEPDPEAAWALALLTSRLNGDPAFALQRLQLARKILPGNAELARLESKLTAGERQ
jgi:hypothetical protein